MKLNHWLALLSFSVLSSCSQQQAPHKISGYIEANYLYIAPPSSGWITDQSIIVGQAVSKNTLLFSLDTSELDIELASAQALLAQQQAQFADSQQGARSEEINVIEQQIVMANTQLDLARKNFHRAKESLSKNALSIAEKDTAESNFKLAKQEIVLLNKKLAVAKLAARSNKIKSLQQSVAAAQQKIEQVKWQIAQKQVYAQQAGVINDIYYRVGEFATQGKPVVSLLLNHQQKVRFYVTQAQLPKMALSQKIQIKTDKTQVAAEQATINYISPKAEFTPPVLYNEESRDSLVFMIEAQLSPTSTLSPGQPVSVTF